MASDPSQDEPLEAFPVDGGEEIPPVAVEAFPPRPPHPNFWWSLLWCFGFLVVTQFGAAIVGVVAVICWELVKSGDVRQYLNDIGTPAGGEALVKRVILPSILLAQVTSILMSCLVLFLVVGRSWPRQLAVRLPSVSHVVLVLLGLPAMVIAGGGVQAVAKQYLPGFDQVPGMGGADKIIEGMSDQPLGLLILAIAIGPALGEELWCRGFLGRGLVGNYGYLVGILLTSFLFGVIHVDPPQAVAAMVLGVCLHYSYIMTRSLLVPMFLHFSNNCLGVLGLTGQLDNLKVPERLTSNAPTEAIFLAALLLLAAVGWALYRGRARIVWAGEGPGWQASYPGVGTPPRDSGMIVAASWPGWIEVGLVVVALSVFIGTCVWPMK